MHLGLERGCTTGDQRRVSACNEVGAGISDGVADDELGPGMRECIVPYTVTRQIVACRGQTRKEGSGAVAVTTDGLVVVVVADVKRVLIVAGHRGRGGSVELTAVKARFDRGVLQIKAGDASIVVVHGDVEHATAHLH